MSFWYSFSRSRVASCKSRTFLRSTSRSRSRSSKNKIVRRQKVGSITTHLWPCYLTELSLRLLLKIMNRPRVGFDFWPTFSDNIIQLLLKLRVLVVEISEYGLLKGTDSGLRMNDSKSRVTDFSWCIWYCQKAIALRRSLHGHGSHKKSKFWMRTGCISRG